MVSSNDSNDEERWATLMARAQQGNEADYRQLLQELSKAIYAFLLSRIGPAHFTEDCVQECLIAIHQARHTYDPKRRFRPWLFAIVRHKAIDMLRRQRSYQSAMLKQREAQYEEAFDTAADETAGQATLLRHLVPGQRAAITLTKLVGLSTAEAARELNISESAVKVRVHRGIGRLKRLMEAE